MLASGLSGGTSKYQAEDLAAEGSATERPLDVN